MSRTLPLLLLLALPLPAAAQARRRTPPPEPLTEEQKLQAEHVRAHYTKYEYRIPMRDGVRLFTAVYVPKDDSKKYPILLNRTPYSVGPYGIDNYRTALGPSKKFAEAGYVFAYQ